MRLSLLPIFLTFVLTAGQAVAAPHRGNAKAGPSTSQGNEFDEDPGPTKIEPTRPTYPNLLEPSDLELNKDSMIIPPRGLKDLNFHIGSVGGNILTSFQQKATQYFGVRYIPYETFEKSWDYTVDAHTEGLIGISVGYRWHILPDEHFNSYYRLAFENFIDSGEALSGLLNLRHMKLMASFGFPDIFEFQRRVVGEVGIGGGPTGFVSYLQIGFNLNL